MTLRELPAGKSALIAAVGGEGALRQHLLDMGLIPGIEVSVVKYAPMGDPMEVRVHDYELALRLADAENIVLETATAGESGARQGGTLPSFRRAHPGLGESGKYHVKTGENPLPKGTLLTFALAGNQNCGKTTLFNQLTGSNQHVGNFPGVTVDRKSGAIRGHTDTQIVDLPGIYSLSPYSGEEMVSRQFILEEKPTGIINIVDATNIERNMYLTVQLMELDIPMVLALNMMDEVEGNGGAIDINAMEEMLGIPVVPISAAKNEGVDELVRHAVHVARYQEKPARQDFCTENDRSGAVNRALRDIVRFIGNRAMTADIPVRFAASKLAEGDELVLEALGFSAGEKVELEQILARMEAERGLDRAAAIADMRFAFIRHVCEKTVIKPRESREHRRSERLDKFLTGKYTAIPAFAAVMAMVFYLTFHVVGAWLQGLLEGAIDRLTDAADALLAAWEINETLHALIIDGIFSGIGSVLSFIPIIITLFFFLSILEDSGYMARVAFVMDKLLRKIGLSGRSIVPMLIGFGCTVPGVMASRTLPSERDRKMTIMLTPFMSCTAKLPVYGFFADAFFPDYSGLVMTGLYFLGIAVGILSALAAKNTVFKGEAVPFVMELPNYRMPGVKNVLRLLWDKAGDFIRRAFTVIFAATVVVWFLETFDFRLQIVEDASQSILAITAGFIAPLFWPLGFGDWRISTSLIAGFMAKESVVSTLTVLLGGSDLSAVLTPLAAASLLVFCLLYTPCVAAVASVKRELGAGWAAWMVVGQCLLAWLCAFLCRIIGTLCGMA